MSAWMQSSSLGEPDGADDDFVPSQTYWSRTLIAVSLASIIAATIFFLLRGYSRWRTCGKLSVEDYTMGVGVLFSWGMCICQIISAYNGVGHDIWSLPRSMRGRVTLLFWLTQKFWVLAQAFVKVSIIVLIRHLLGSINLWRRVTTALIIFTIAWAITGILGNIFHCWPPQYFWIKSIEGHCMAHQLAFFITIGSLSAAEDVVLLIIPIIIVWKIKLAPREKIQLTLLFSCGGLVCIFSVLRLVEFNNYATDNLTLSGALEGIWTTLEINLAIICASVILMRPLFRSCTLSTWLRCCCTRPRTSPNRGPETATSSDFVHFFEQWPYKIGGGEDSIFSQDVYSQVQAHAYPTPVEEVRRSQSRTRSERKRRRGHGSVRDGCEIVRRLTIEGIRVETSIDRNVQDRETVLASAFGEEAGSPWSSRASSVGGS